MVIPTRVEMPIHINGINTHGGRRPRCRYAQACGCQARMDSTLAENPEGTEGGPWTTGSL